MRACAALTLLLAQEAPLREDAAKALRKAVDYFRTQVAVQGGYVWRYSEDLSRREGEGKASATTAWVQPPGTPTIGLAYLAAGKMAQAKADFLKLLALDPKHAKAEDARIFLKEM